MIYITCDSNIWIYSLDESWQIENQLDYLEPWIEKGEVKLLLPKMVISEWGNHENKQADERKKKLNDFFNMAEEILPSAFFAEYKEPTIQKKIIDEQLNRAKKLVLQSEIIPDYPEVTTRVITDGIAKKAPLHRKSSVADAIIVFSLIHFAKVNPGNHYFFISSNTEDFYQKNQNRKEIHEHLKEDFDTNNIQAFTTLNQLIRFLKTTHGLVTDENIEQRRKERIRNKVKERAYNPEYDKITESGQSSYIQNINTIEFILKESKPTKEQVIFILALIDSDTSYEYDFYKRLRKGNWFNILNRKGVFKPDFNPRPVIVNGIRQVPPHWLSLYYLEKISENIKEGYELEFIDETLKIISNISKKPVDNNSTWYRIITILVNLPNDKVKLEILGFIPTWLNSDFNTTLESIAICKNLLPKFLSESPTNEDIEKAEKILSYLFTIEKKADNEESVGFDYTSYYSRVEMDNLINTLIDDKFTSKIAEHCSNEIIFQLTNNLKTLYLDFPNGIIILLKVNGNEYNVKIDVVNEDLNICISEKSDTDKVINTSILMFENYTDEEIKNLVISAFLDNEIGYEDNEENEENLESLIVLLKSGSHYSFHDDTISKLNEITNYEENLINVFSLIFRDIFSQKTKQNPIVGLSLLRSFLFENKYNLFFFRRVSLYVIGENWDVCKNLFWEIVSDNDPLHLFSNNSFSKDLYEVLDKNQFALEKGEIITLQKIIDIGNQSKKSLLTANEDYWKLRWYSSLRNILPFKDYYQKLSEEKNITNKHYEESGRVQIRAASTSPFSSDDILKKTNLEIVNFIHAFKPKDRWEEPTIDGFSNALGKAIEDEPQKFSDEINLYKDVYFVYSYKIAIGFKEAWKSKKSFNWGKVLAFFKAYITSEKFKTEEFILENGTWLVTSDWVIGAITNLLSEGMQSDDNAFDISLLPIVKDFLIIIIPNLIQIENVRQTNIDYPTYSLNSTNSKILRALLDYSLRRARNLKSEYNLPKWEKDIKNLLEVTFQKGIIDVYILTGWYFEQFYFLDKDWITTKVKEYYNLEDKEWIPFMSGIAFANPPFNKETYQLFYPHYQRAIDKNVEIKKKSYTNGIIRHLVAFYFWGFEELEDSSLILRLIQTKNHKNIVELVNFIWRQESYTENLNSDDSKKFEIIIFNLWNLLAEKYENATEEDEQNVLLELSNFLVFIDELNDVYTALILKSKQANYKHFYSHRLIENLMRLKDNGESNKVAKNIGLIFNSILFGALYTSRDNNNIINLVIFLYENGQKDIADEFCNKVTKRGYEFLIEIHNRYKE